MPPADVVVQVFGTTDVGRTREHNEDAFLVADLSTGDATPQPEVRRHVVGRRGTMFMVADGMGGAAAGEIASAMATEIVLRELKAAWSNAHSADAESFARALRRAAVAANDEIHTFALQHPEYRGMGTTATIAGLLGDTLYVAHVGDSRAYLVRDGVARQITKDQSLMQKLVEAGELTEEEAEVSERRNIILQALGPEASVKVDLTHQKVRRGDTLVLCSDGLSGQVTRDEIAAYVTGEDDLVALCSRLIDRANETGGPDNITVVAARFDGSALHAGGDDTIGHRTFPLPDTGQTPAMRDGAAGRTTGPQPIVERAAPDANRPLPGGRASPTNRPAPSDGLSPAALPAETPAALPPAMAGGGMLAGVSPERRKAGMFVAIALLVLLVALAGWFVFRKAATIVPRDAAPPASAEPASGDIVPAAE